MTDYFAAKSRRNYFATKIYLIFTWTTLTRLLKRLLLLKMLNPTEKLTNYQVFNFYSTFTEQEIDQET